MVAKQYTVQFGKTSNQIYHTFRHIDELGLSRSAVQNAILEHFPSVSNQLMQGRSLNGVIEIGGHTLQYTAFEISEGIINIGRIHGI